MICPQCHADVAQTNKYCNHCGTSLSKTTTEHIPSSQYMPLGIFSDHELNVLLETNRRTVSGNERSSTITQSDIDKLFE